jgi:hypothetical protein
VKALRGKFNEKSIVPAMAATLEADFANSLRKTVKEQSKLDDEMAKVFGRQSELGVLDGKIAGEKDAAKKKELEAKRDALAGEIRAAEDAIRAQEKSLYELKPKAS